jgi:hypothetical protein
MTITSRTVRFLPSMVIVADSKGITSAPNHSNAVQEEPFVFAYRKAKGTDKRVRILTSGESLFGCPMISMYYIDTEPKAKIVPVASGNIEVQQNFGTSLTLSEWWEEELAKGNTGFSEGKTYSLKSYSFDILSTEELDAIAASTLYINNKDYASFTANYKY